MGLMDTVKSWFGKAKETAEPVVEKAGDAAGKAWEKTKPAAEKAAEKAGEVAGKAWEKTKPVAEKAGEAAGKAWDKTKDVAGDVKDKVSDRAKDEDVSGGGEEPAE
jgi:colicin import membrane protein